MQLPRSDRNPICCHGVLLSAPAKIPWLNMHGWRHCVERKLGLGLAFRQLSKTVAVSEQTRSYFHNLSHFSDILWLWFLSRIRWKFLHWELLVLQEKAGEWNVAHHLLQQMVITGLRHKGGTWPDQFSIIAAFFWVPWFMIDKCI